ncbi:MAG: DUF2231 domain-containing protein [Beutenbergiaceae bacterium]
MFDQVLGLPMHILVLHAVVVLGPIAAISAIAYSVRPTWRWYLKWPTLMLAVIAGIAAFVTGQSGEALQQQMIANGAAGELLQNINDHAQAGKVAAALGIAFMVVTIAAVWFVLPAGPHPGQSEAKSGLRLNPVVRQVTAGLTIAVAIALIVAIALAGHLGATAAWDGVF